MDIKTIENQIATKGYASLTQSQKDFYNNYSATIPQTVAPSSRTLSYPSPDTQEQESLNQYNSSQSQLAGMQKQAEELQRQVQLRQQQIDNYTNQINNYIASGANNDQINAFVQTLNVPTDLQQDVYNKLSSKGIDTNSITGDPSLDAMLKAVQGQLDNLAKRGQVLNPNIAITPEKAAEFLTQASQEIDPYYSGQLKLAKDTLLNSTGYTQEEIQRYENDMEKKYGVSLRNIGETSADQGFALSGGRQRNEADLAYNTNQQIASNRNNLSYQAGNVARTFAQDWGTSNLPTSNITTAPRAIAGTPNFESSSNMTPFYSLSPEVYQGLIGSKQYEQQAAKQTRSAQLENAFRSTQATNDLRKLIL